MYIVYIAMYKSIKWILYLQCIKVYFGELSIQLRKDIGVCLCRCVMCLVCLTIHAPSSTHSLALVAMITTTVALTKVTFYKICWNGTDPLRPRHFILTSTIGSLFNSTSVWLPRKLIIQTSLTGVTLIEQWMRLSSSQAEGRPCALRTFAFEVLLSALIRASWPLEVSSLQWKIWSDLCWFQKLANCLACQFASSAWSRSPVPSSRGALAVRNWRVARGLEMAPS